MVLFTNHCVYVTLVEGFEIQCCVHVLCEHADCK